ncbi:MAG: hypothetical protein K8J31_27810 [Anaerolineae bacterium]|nr:hypothetical protein [Anaerolineae bacterium]
MTSDSSEDPKIEIERRRLALEEKRLAFEERKALRDRLAVLVPVLVALLTIAFNVYAQYQTSLEQQRQAQIDFAAQQRQAEIDFQLKVAEIVLDSTNPVTVINKARALHALMPNYFPTDFESNYVTEDYDAANKLSQENRLRVAELAVQLLQLEADVTGALPAGDVTMAWDYNYQQLAEKVAGGTFGN